MANTQLPSLKKSQSDAGHSRAKAESYLDSQFGCPMCGLIGLSPSFLRAIHMPSCLTDCSKSVDESPCPQYSDVATFNTFIDCQGNKYFSDNYEVCTQCHGILHLKLQFGLSTCPHHNCDVFPNHCMSRPCVSLPEEVTALLPNTLSPLFSKGTKKLKLCHPFVQPTM